ncbi:Thylakoid membrane protein TERC, chloroplastic, partial [Cucurbita argyrosperma subsp. argyrosperma]
MICWFGNIESGAYIWYCWCNCLSSNNHTSRNSHFAGNFLFNIIFHFAYMVYLRLYLLFQRFEGVNLLLAAILLFSSFQLFASDEEDDSDLSDNFVVKTCQKLIPVAANYDGNHFFTLQEGVKKVSHDGLDQACLEHFGQATPLLLTVAVIELSDIAFAVDSIPAVFGVTRDPFIVFTSNLFAILGLRSLFVLVSDGMSELEYLQPSIGVVLAFVGSKMILDFFGFHVPTEASLGFVALSLSTGVLLSVLKKSDGS